MEVEEARDQVHAAMEGLQTLLNLLNAKICALQKQQRYLVELKVMRSQRHDEIASSIININTRGTIFEIEKDILTRVDGCYFDVMLSIDETMIGESKASVPVYFIDRSYEGFEKILSNMSGDELHLEGMTRYDIRIVQDNMDYFNLYPTRRVLVDYSTSIDIKVKNGICSMIELSDGRLCTGRHSGIIEIRNIESRMVEDNQVVLSGHILYVTSLALLPDGRLCSGSSDRTITIWDTPTGQCEMTLIGHTCGILSLCALSDTRVCSGSNDNTIKIWNIHSGVCELTVTGHRKSLRSLMRLADGRICSGSDDKTIKVWNTESGICEVTLTGHTTYVYVVVQLRDGRICSGSGDKSIKI